MLVTHVLDKVVVTTPIVRTKPEDDAMKRARSKGCTTVWTRPHERTKKNAVDKPRRQH